ncbi:hypothetical protein EB796_003823 [Bugula neritina]|uniref:Small VCP/p97-interacting protein n=1 Tax=Bugula neritina TaxID=10212 RepID=A0A7J7KKJ6_BUGNE|nr:hypothetical protein EB796_003823 [Bugula neritina]
MGCCFGCFGNEDDGYYQGDGPQNSQRTNDRVSIEERREKAREAAERRQMANQSRGVGHNPRLEAKQKRLEKEEKKAILSGRANQPGNLSWKME